MRAEITPSPAQARSETPKEQISPGVLPRSDRPVEDGANKVAPLLSFRDVRVRIDETDIVAAISFELRAGPTTVLLGPNGSGKTTLLKLAMGLLTPTQGAVNTRRDLRRALVFQRPIMLRRSAAENVLFARSAAGLGADWSTGLRLLDLVGLAHVADRPARKLSGGEQQRLALARALAREPDLLLLDEPTASLDPAAAKLVEDVIARVSASGVTIVMATHDLGQAKRLGGEVVFMVGGRIVEKATGETFFRQPETAAARRFLTGDFVF